MYKNSYPRDFVDKYSRTGCVKRVVMKFSWNKDLWLSLHFKNVKDVFIYRCIKKSCFTFSEVFQLANGNKENIRKDLCNTQTLKLSLTSCYLCGDTLNEDVKKLSKVRDHCRYTGNYLGIVHLISNLQYKKHSYIPALAYNASEYDNHFILPEPKIGKVFKECDSLCLGKNHEKLSFFI